MPPKNKSVDELVLAMSAQLTELSDQFKTFTTKQEEFDGSISELKKLLKTTQEENVALKEKVKNQASEILELKTRINIVEQHNRSDCLRVLNVPIPGDNSDPVTVAHAVYKTALLPILEGAVAKGRLDSVPSCSALIKTAHILPSKSEIKPIYLRLHLPHIKLMLLQLKKEFGPRAPLQRSGSATGPLRFPIYEDMTRDFFRAMRALSTDDRVNACWFAGGSLRVKLEGSDSVKRTSAVFSTVDEIIAELS